jgi:hypothetical protein
MLLEDILLVAVIGIGVLLIGAPLYRFWRAAPWRRRDPVAEARERLRVATLEAEAARINRQAEKVYDDLYAEALGEERGRGSEPASEAAPPADLESRREGKRHGDK